jgi:hypothetical protein
MAHIYTCTEGEEYTKKTLKKYNNKNANTYLIVLIRVMLRVASVWLKLVTAKVNELFSGD